MGKKLLIIASVLSIVCISFPVYPWVGKTHRKITEEVEKTNDILRNYLTNMGFTEGEKTDFTLQSSGYYLPAHFKSRAILFSDFDYTNSALDWLTIGSVEEDTPITRAMHHFHDPTTLEGLDDPALGQADSARFRAFDDTQMGFRWSGPCDPASDPDKGT